MMTKQNIFYERAIQLFKEKNFDAAIENFKKSLSSNNENPIFVYNNISISYILKYRTNKSQQNLKDLDEAISYSMKAISINKNDFTAHNNLGLCNLIRNNFEFANNHFKKAIESNPQSKDLNLNLATVNKYLCNFEEAEYYYKKFFTMDPNDLRNRASLGEVQLSLNNFKEGWENFEFREERRKIKAKINFSKPLWSPNLGYGRILIWGDHGIGDKVLYSTIIHGLINKFKKIYLLIDKKLMKFFKENFPSIEVYDFYKDFIDLELFDFHLPISSLGKYFRHSPDDFLNNHKNFVIKSSDDFNKKNKLRCAISWKSNAPTGSLKSVDLYKLKKILKLPEYEFYSIQYTDAEDDIKNMKKNHDIKIFQEPNLNVYDDIHSLLKFLKSCDVVLTISNTNAHLAASLGIPTFLLLSKGPGTIWYWLNVHNNKNLWYPSLKIFQQKDINDWSLPINDAYESLKNLIK